MQESNLFFEALRVLREYKADTGTMPVLLSENVHGRRLRTWDKATEAWRQPFIKEEADAVIDSGYTELGWREISTADVGVPNPKKHVLLMATAGFGSVVDNCLFSSV